VQVELLGANIAANGSREQMSYTIDCLRRCAQIGWGLQEGQGQVGDRGGVDELCK